MSRVVSADRTNITTSTGKPHEDETLPENTSNIDRAKPALSSGYCAKFWHFCGMLFSCCETSEPVPTELDPITAKEMIREYFTLKRGYLSSLVFLVNATAPSHPMCARPCTC